MERLSKPRSDFYERMAKEHERQQQQELQNLPFKPTVNDNPQLLRARKGKKGRRCTFLTSVLLPYVDARGLVGGFARC